MWPDNVHLIRLLLQPFHALVLDILMFLQVVDLLSSLIYTVGDRRDVLFQEHVRRIDALEDFL